MHVILQDEEKKARTEARESEKKKEREEKDAAKAHGRAKEIAGKAVAKIAPVLTELLPKVKDVNNMETESFSQLPMLMKTQLKASLSELQTINTIASDCLSGSCTDVEFDIEFIKTAVTNAIKIMRSLTNLRQ